MLDFRLSHLRHFLMVAETKSYRTAARRGFRSQPAVSQSIRQLEQRLGQPLFERGARTTLTPFGEWCLPLVRELVAHIERSTASMQHVAQVTGGRVSLAILPSVASRWLPPVLRRFAARHPGVDVRVMAEDSRHVQRLVAESEVDFAVSSRYEPDAGLDFEPLVRDRFALLCRRDHPLAATGRPLEWSALRGQTVLGNVMHRMLTDTPAWPFVASPAVFVSNLPTLLALVEDGLGVTPIPALACPSPSATLVHLPLRGPVYWRTIGLMTLKGRSLIPAAQALLLLLRAYLEETAERPRSTGRAGPAMIRLARGR